MLVLAIGPSNFGTFFEVPSAVTVLGFGLFGFMIAIGTKPFSTAFRQIKRYVLMGGALGSLISAFFLFGDNGVTNYASGVRFLALPMIYSLMLTSCLLLPIEIAVFGILEQKSDD